MDNNIYLNLITINQFGVKDAFDTKLNFFINFTFWKTFPKIKKS
jgi:hypothetical protein